MEEGTCSDNGCRRLSLLDHMSTIENRRDSFTGLTLEGLLRLKKPIDPAPVQVNRTLLDIIRDEQRNGSLIGHKGKKAWKIFRNRFRNRKAVAGWISSVRVVTVSSVDSVRPEESSRSSPETIRDEPTSETESNGLSVNRGGSPTRSLGALISLENLTRREIQDVEVAREGTRRLSVVLEEERVLSARVEEEEEPVRMSLMNLLEETCREMGFVGPIYAANMIEGGIGNDDTDDDVTIHGDGMIEYTCCVCMVRRKGAAFIPCGHTFCRLCSREVWVQRGNCPICNGIILEILDIF